ncbi:MAG: recombination protein NinB [bacterium]|nr:recombination protein NinB [bacterium]
MSTERVWIITDRQTMAARYRACWEICLAMMALGPVELIIRPRKSKRSIDQNRRLWALNREVAATVWLDGRQFSDQSWHEQFKRWFIGIEEVRMPDGTIEQRGMSTAGLNVGDFSDYMRSVETWCADQGYPVMLEAA